PTRSKSAAPMGIPPSLRPRRASSTAVFSMARYLSRFFSFSLAIFSGSRLLCSFTITWQHWPLGTASPGQGASASTAAQLLQQRLLPGAQEQVPKSDEREDLDRRSSC